MHPLGSKLSPLDSVKECGTRLRTTVSDRIPPLSVDRPRYDSSLVDGNIQGHGLGNFKGGQNGWIKTNVEVERTRDKAGELR